VPETLTPAAVNTCASCTATRDKPAPPRLPRGWKRQGESVYCPKCWGTRHLLRAITLPITEPLDCDWKTLDTELALMWRATTQASNWMMTELYARDVRRTDEAKCPPMTKQYLYPEARKRFPVLPSTTVAALENTTQAKYRALRYDVIWTYAKSLPTFRYPVPFPLPNQSWSVVIEGEVPIISVRLGDQRMRLRLRGGARYRRQIKAVAQMASGEAITGELALYRQGKHIMAKLVAWLPRAEDTKQESHGTLSVRTAPDSLLVALNIKDEKLWTYHGDHLKRWAAEHQLQLQRWADDQKAEQRPVATFSARREAATAKYNQRLSSACHEIAAQLTGYAQRRHFAVLIYDDTERSYCPDFRYARLTELLQEKLDALGIEFRLASGEAREKTEEALADGVN
jgi:hypothetical protein